jgi:hypothetical protein
MKNKIISKADYQKMIDRNINKLKAYHFVTRSDSEISINKGLIVNIKI